MPQRALIKLARDAEDAASGLRVFRDSLPRNATRITAVIGEFFAISSSLRQLDNAEGDPRFQPSFYRIRDDVGMLYRSLHASVTDVFGMFARSRDRPRQMVWEDLQHKMEQDEDEGLLERLQCYRGVLQAQFDIVTGRRPSGLSELRMQLASLLAAQGVDRVVRTPVDMSGQNTPRPRVARPQPRIVDIPISPMAAAGRWDYEQPPPFAPDPPPLSPTFTSSLSATLLSTHISYSNESVPTWLHWAQQVHNGTNPVTPFRDRYKLYVNFVATGSRANGCSEDPSECHGSVDLTLLPRLAQDGFLIALQLPFDGERLWVRIYSRPLDKRARMLVMTKAVGGNDQHYCVPLPHLKIMRDLSCLKLCRARDDGRYVLWAKLNFGAYESVYGHPNRLWTAAEATPGMVLFYCTFVAMKHQDEHGIPHEVLLDSFELNSDDREGERLCFSGVIKHGEMRHSLRLFQDRACGGVRLEASAKRGPMKDVPIWTAFVTRYAIDPDWPQYEGGGVVSLGAVKPPPYIFLPQYNPPRNRAGEYVQHFTTSEDGKQFVETWAGLSRS